jgi:hypothetical protein
MNIVFLLLGRVAVIGESGGDPLYGRLVKTEIKKKHVKNILASLELLGWSAFFFLRSEVCPGRGAE